MGVQIAAGAAAQKHHRPARLFQGGKGLRHTGVELCTAALNPGEHPGAHLFYGPALFRLRKSRQELLPRTLRRHTDPGTDLPVRQLPGRSQPPVRQAVVDRLHGRSVDPQALVEGAVVVEEEAGHPHASRARIRFTISMAPWAHSAPLLPALVPARSMACSMVSVVRTPNITGMSLLSATLATPLETSLHT